MTLILGIETSCDETAAAVIENGHIIRSNVVASQIDLHRQYGGVFPEMASRQHMLTIQPVIDQAVRDAGETWSSIDAIAVTHGPGLSGSLLVGVNLAKGLAYGQGLPLIGVNHIEAHIATNWLDSGLPGGLDNDVVSPPPFPLLCLIVSGGHTELVLMHDYGTYQRLGSTIDDAAGEAFDKVARLLGLPYPGGPSIQRVAESGNPKAFKFPIARVDGRFDFSFSGLKTAVLRAVQQYEPNLERVADRLPGRDEAKTGLHEQTVADMAASFQSAAVEALVAKTLLAEQEHQVNGVLMAGGVAANKPLRQRMAAKLKTPLLMPPISLATDNATGVGVVGYWSMRHELVDAWDLDVIPRLKLGSSM